MSDIRYLRVFIIFFIIFALSTRLGVSSWNDAARMATIESIVERKSFIIDDATFDTGDKYFYNNHYYSDKPPLLAIFASPIYFILRALGITLSNRPQLAYYLITLFSIGSLSALGLAIFRKSLTEFFLASDGWADLITLVTGTGTLILPYSLVFNNHIVSGFLIFTGFYFILNTGKNGDLMNSVYSGLLFSLAGSIEITCFIFLPFALLTFLRKSYKMGLAFVLSCLPVIALFLFLNLVTSDSILPPELNPSLRVFPGSEFNDVNLTGLAQHTGFADLMAYVFHMILGNRGMISHSPILLFSLAGFLFFFKRNQPAGYKTDYALLLIGALVVIWLIVVRSVDYGGFSFGIRRFATLMLIFCIPLAFIESWVRSSKIIYGGFIVVGCLSILISVIGSYNPFTPGADISAGQANLVENTIALSINILLTASTTLGKLRIFLLGFLTLFLFFIALKRLAPVIETKTA